MKTFAIAVALVASAVATPTENVQKRASITPVTVKGNGASTASPAIHLPNC